MSTTKASQSNSTKKPKVDEPEELRPPTDQSVDRLTAEAEKLDAPAKLSKDDKDFIDADPGYSTGQVEQMREYYGIGQ